MKIKTFFAAAIAAAVACTPAHAAGELKITDAIEMTLTNNLSLKSLRQEAAKAYARKVGARGLWTPSLSVTAYVDDQRENQTSDGSNRTSARVARATLSQTLYNGGRNSALQRQARAAETIADLRLADGENAVIGELFARFYNVLLQEGRVEAGRSAVLTSEAHLRELERKSELGLSNRLEVIRAQGSLASNRANLTAAEGLYESALISLMDFMGHDPEDRLYPDGELRVIAPSGSRAESLELAMTSRADRLALISQIAQQDDQIEIERASMRPTVSLNATAGYLDPYRNADRGSDTWRAELSITVPILDRNSSRSNVLNAQAVQEQNKISLEQKELEIRSGVETAWIELESSTHRLESTRLALELAEETLRLSEVGFQEGVTPQLDLLSAQTSLTEARLNNLSALYNRMLAIVALKVTEGGIIKWTDEVDF